MWLVLLWLAAAGALAGGLWRVVLPRLAEPDDPDAAGKLRYAYLVTPTSTFGVVLLAVGAQLLVCWRVPPQGWPAWLVLSSVGVVLAVVDARTTWMPARMCQIGWAGLAAAVTGSLMAGGPALGSAAGALAVWALFLVAWLVSWGGFGFSDVRFVPLLGAALGAISWSAVFAGILCGCLLTAAVMLAMRGRKTVTAWAPGLIFGAYVATFFPT